MIEGFRARGLVLSPYIACPVGDALLLLDKIESRVSIRLVTERGDATLTHALKPISNLCWTANKGWLGIFEREANFDVL
jgi:hypothetical protein